MAENTETAVPSTSASSQDAAPQVQFQEVMLGGKLVKVKKVCVEGRQFLIVAKDKVPPKPAVKTPKDSKKNFSEYSKKVRSFLATLKDNDKPEVKKFIRRPTTRKVEDVQESESVRARFPKSKTPSTPLKGLCRLCGVQTEGLTEIFGQEGKEKRLAQKIHCYLPIVVSPGDLLPTSVCPPCVQTLENSHQHAVAVRAADRTLRDKLRHQNQANIITLDPDLQSLGDSVLDLWDHEGPESESPQRVRGRRGSHLVHMGDGLVTLDPESAQSSRSALPFSCHFCPEEMRLSRPAYTHYARKHRKFLCVYCFQVYIDRPSLRSHVRERHLVNCHLCGEEMLGLLRLKRHLGSHHRTAIPTPLPKKEVFKHKCQFCSKLISFRTSIRKHYLTEHSQYLCFLCLQSFDSEPDLATHVFVENHDTKCKLCNKEFFSKNSYDFHMSSTHSEHTPSLPVEFYCQLCKNKSATFPSLKRHVHFHHASFCCGKCHSVHPSISELDSHSLSTHGHKSGLVLCSVCSQPYDSPILLAEHMKTHQTAPASILCELCGKAFQTMHAMQIHRGNVHRRKNYLTDKFCCELCPRKFGYQRELERHIKHHNNVKDVVCHMCDKKFADASGLKIHLTLHNLGAGEKNFQCTICGKKYRSKTNLHSHFSTAHVQEWTYTCNICRTEFGNKEEAETHYIAHSSEEKLANPCQQQFSVTSPHQCDVCHDYFASRARLRDHLKQSHNIRVREVMNKESLHTCAYCSKGFADRANLEQHVQIHVLGEGGLMSYECKFCSKKFKTPGKCRRHENRHTNSNPFPCNLCNRTFITEKVLGKHLRTTHGNTASYPCGYCSSTFKSVKMRDIHTKYHTHHFNYRCQSCIKGFDTYEELMRHRNVHRKKEEKLKYHIL